MLVLGWWDHAQGSVEPAVVVPIDPVGGGVFDVGEGLVWAFVEEAGGDAFGLEQADDGFHQAVVVGVANGADRGCDPFQGEVFGEADRSVLAAGVVMIHQLAGEDGVALSMTIPQRDRQRCQD